jgi:hypothetical protein
MARNTEDIIDISFQLQAHISLDIERIIEDPIWKIICIQNGFEEDFHKELLQEYLNHYIIRERFLSEMPCTNGPGNLTQEVNHG